MGTIHKNANSVAVDPDRLRQFAYMRRLTLTAIGPLFDRCEGWASVICSKRRVGYYALDELACALGMRVEDLIEEIGTDEERERNHVAC